MSVILVTGSAGLIGSETVKFYCRRGYDVVGIDPTWQFTYDVRRVLEEINDVQKHVDF